MSAVRTHAAFENNFVSILDKNAPKKTKILRGNQKPHPNMNLRKQILIRSRLKNKANKSKNPIGIATFPAGIYLLKVNNRNTRTRCEICSF